MSGDSWQQSTALTFRRGTLILTVLLHLWAVTTFLISNALAKKIKKAIVCIIHGLENNSSEKEFSPIPKIYQELCRTTIYVYTCLWYKDKKKALLSLSALTGT